MIRIEQLKLPYHHEQGKILQTACKKLHLSPDQIEHLQIVKKSIDARKKPEIFAVYTVDLTLLIDESKLLKGKRLPNVRLVQKTGYTFPPKGTAVLRHRPVIVGTGPAGLFCGYMLALHGYRPILLERGGTVEERLQCVETFWKENRLSPNSNVQFGEGGAGTFSDGKLNTLIKDKNGRGQHVLELFVKYGAPEEILYLNKPHIGTDILSGVVKRIRNAIIEMGGEVRFHSLLSDIQVTGENINSVEVTDTSCEHGKTYLLDTNLLVLAIGHSARDTFHMLQQKEIPMESKSFAVGVRVEHPQSMINHSQYGPEKEGSFPAADYKLTAQLEDGKGVYSFCMCPGGYVVNASSEPGHLAVNGMSYHDRCGVNANSAIVVTVSKDDFGSVHPLAGIEFQRMLEKKAFLAGGGKIPVQLFGDFCKNQASTAFEEIQPQMKGAFCLGNVRAIFPETVASAIESGMKSFDLKIKGFAREDVLLSGVESRTSSPVRITRNDNFQSMVKGLYPCGEGAGYAGGITSAAIDGMKIAEAVASCFLPFD